MRDTLEKKLAEKPDDPARHEEYARWLTAQADPRGELVMLQMALENQQLAPDRRFELEHRERQLLAQHGRTWLGDVADYILARPTADRPFELKAGCEIWWWRGWVQGLQLDELTLKLARVLLHAPQMRFFRRMVFTEPCNASCDYLHEWGLLARLKHIDMSFGRITDKGALALAADKDIRRLETLDLTGNQIGAEGVAAIRKAFPRVSIEDQNPIVIVRDEATGRSTAEGGPGGISDSPAGDDEDDEE